MQALADFLVNVQRRARLDSDGDRVANRVDGYTDQMRPAVFGALIITCVVRTVGAPLQSTSVDPESLAFRRGVVQSETPLAGDTLSCP